MTKTKLKDLESEGNQTVRDYSGTKCLHHLFAEQVALTPKAVAVSFADQSVTYAELNDRANRVARTLLSRGVGREALVGICVERSLEMVVGLLGILKAGAAYIPIDPNYPHERIQFMLDDAQVSVLLTQESLLSRLPTSEAQVLCLDRDWPEIQQASGEDTASNSSVDDLAYVIYTSGSTGRPKGVLVTHANVTRLFSSTTAWFNFGSQDVWTMFHSFAFDFSVWELWGALLHGGRLVLVPTIVSRTPEAFYDLLRREQVTVLNQTPSAFQQLVKVVEKGDVPTTELSLRLVIFGGEALDISSLAGWFERYGDERPQLVNMYGITETTVHVTYRPLRRADLQGPSVIGGPLPDLQIHLLDENLRPVTQGQVGEIYVGGAGVARGYLRRPDLTKQRFIADPFSCADGARLYRSGDLARQTATGELEYVGRCDQQVKIRGFRIELGEIEATLNKHPQVTQCVVVMREETPGDQRLVAYVIAAQLQQTVLLANDLRSYLRVRLPDYMLPASFVVLDELPLTPNGKIDRSALPVPQATRTLAPDAVAARTATEELLVDIWTDVLQLDGVGVEDNFFELGGHSLLVAKVISRIRDSYNVEVPQRLLFEHPTIAGLSRLIESNGLLKTSQSLALIPRCSRNGSLPISLQQEQVWFIEQLHPENKSYNSQSTIRFQGLLDHDALKASLTEIVRRHEVLRTTFPTVAGRPVQIVQPPREVSLPVIDLEALPGAQREAEAQRLIESELKRRFDLSVGPLICWTLLRFGPADHLLIHVEHHFVHDGWSFNIVVGELIEIYRAFSECRPSPLAELPIQYADFASWQRTWLQGAEAREQLAYWTKQLVDCPKALELPTDRPRQAQQTFAGAALRIDLVPELCAALRTLSRNENATLYMTLFAAFVALLHRYTGDEDISVGSGVGNRCWREVEGLIGMFVNTLVVRADVSGDPTYRELLSRVREVTLAAYSHQSVPFNQVVEVLQPDRDLSRNPLFQVAFSFHDAPRPSMSLPGLKIGVTEALNNGSAKFDLNIIVITRPLPKEPDATESVAGGMTMIWEYNSGLFTSQTLERMVQHYQRILDAIVRHPEQRVSRLPLLNEAERQELLLAPNQTEREYPRSSSVAALFEKQAALTPEAPAVILGPAILSYRELNERANQLARYLQSRGVGVDHRESLVGVMLRRSADLIVSLLAVLKAGAAYLPLDADDPDERLRFMMADAGVEVVLTEAGLLEKLGDFAVGLCLDRETAEIQGLDHTNLDTKIDGDSLAYLMYTSGSTGRPKGIAIEQHCINRLVINTDYVQLNAADRVAHVSNVSFDAATFEIWGALLNGAAVVVISKDMALSPHELAVEIEQKQINTLFLTTALFNQMASVAPAVFGSVKQVLFGGEAVDPHRVREVLKHGPPERLLHVYGPTETTTFASWHLIESVPAAATNIPIGKPLANTRLYVLDEQLAPVPVGLPGELYIGGEGVGRGYWNQPELTAERFIEDPFSATQQRMYRTGDVVRRLADGALEFIRRKDQQVKLRGYRIELGEIETVLREHESVRECVVIVREDQPGDKRLVAYLVPAASAAVNVTDLRGYLKQRLPDYMVPTAFVTQDSLPLTPNGKIAINQLPVPASAAQALETADVEPRTATEELLVSIYAGVLHRGTVGITDDFFELGGHSLLATQVIARIRECFHIELPLRTLFSEPTIAGLSPLVDAAREKTSSLRTGPIVPVARQNELPLSFAQQRLWFLDQLEPHNSAYNIAAALRLNGSLDVAALTASLKVIIERHEVLRTRFPVSNGRPMQVITPVDDPFTIPCEDLTHLSESDFAHEIQLRLKREAETPFDLSAGPLLRVTLLVQSGERYALLLTMHHIITDGWSLNLFRQEFVSLYESFVNGQPSPLRPLIIQYADYAMWQREWFNNGAIQKQLDYWRDQLNDITTLHLPTDHVRPAVQTFSGRRIVTRLNPELTREIKKVSQEESATLFMTLLAAFAVLLSRYSGQNDITVGSPIASRDRREVEDLIGFFVNTLVLRVDLGGELSFRELLSKVRDVTLDAYANQELPFERLVEELNQPRDLSRSPVFQVLFSLLNLPAAQLDKAGLHWSEFEAYSDVAKFDLSLTVREIGEQLEVAFQYNTDLFEESTIKRMVRHYEHLLTGIVNDPTQSLSALPLLSEEERRQQVREWNETATEYPRNSCIHRLFEAEAERRPHAIALEFGNEQLSYGELNAQANQLAHYLRQLGVGAEMPVGVMLSRSPKMIVALLAVLKSGGAYVPLDLEYPVERLRYMLADAAVGVLLTDGPGLERVVWFSGATVRLDHELESIRKAPTSNLEGDQSGESLAYVMYTSGSMGLPKGICIEHRGVVRLVRNTNYVKLDEHQVLLQFAPVSFDASTFEIWGALLNGGRLVLAQNERTSLAELGAQLQQKGITTLWLTAGLFHLMVDEQLEALRGVQQLLAGGDVLSVRHVKRVLDELPGCKLINGYGPTENTTFTSCHMMERRMDLGASVPIGRPIANTQVYVLNDRQELVPLGVAGELYVGGDGVGRGYLNQPELTASRFLPDPFRAEEGGRLYRTGDTVRWQPGGVLEFLGRADDQVKLRGYRIELREVETVLSLHDSVSECLVLLRTEAGGDKRLIAYVVGRKGAESLSARGLRGFLKERLPDYMIPAAFVLLAELPLTANGKVDTTLLPPPEIEGDRDLQANLTPTEELLVNIYAAVLNRDSVGIADDFFDLGGHSLLATQVVSRIRECFHVELPLRALFAEPTIAGLSPMVEVARQQQPSARTHPIARLERNDELPLSFAQQRLWFLDQLEPQNTAYNIAGALRLSGPLDADAVTRSLQAIVERHQVLRTSFPVSHGRPIQCVAPTDGFRVAILHEQRNGLTEARLSEEINQVLREETQEPFDLATGPLFRVRLLSLAPGEQALIFTLHHIVSDGWSLRILFQEFAAFYNAAVTGRACTPAELPVQYGDYSVWQRDWLHADEMEEKVAYWRNHLAGLTTVQLPTDRVRPPLQSFRGGRVATTLPKTLSGQLQDLNRREGVTLFMSLLAGFAVLLARYSASEDITVGSPIAGRNHRELEELIGFFVNTLVLRTDLRGDPTFRSLLDQAREVTLNAYANQEVPFERLVEELQPRRDLSRSPLFQIMFSVLNVPHTDLQIEGVVASEISGSSDTAKFDLSLTAREISGHIELAFQYNTDLFDESTVAQMLKHYERLLVAIVANPELRVSELDLLTESERTQLERYGHKSLAPVPSVSLVTLFERQVEHTGANVALECGDERLTYAEFNERINQLAHHLRAVGVGPEVVVGVLLERGVNMVVAVLAILKAGGGYLPLDPQLPSERLSFMVADAAGGILVTEESTLEDAGLRVNVKLVLLDKDREVLAQENKSNPTVVDTPENLAYVIYTSGSTGKPKGVMVERRSLVNLVVATQKEFGLVEKDTLVAVTTLSFDIAAVDLFLPLVSGATLVVARKEEVLDVQQLRLLLERTQATMMQATPTMWRMLVDIGWAGHSQLKVLCGGEVLTRELASQLLERSAAVWNGYGPTETTIYSSMHRVRSTLTSGATIPIGQPTLNTELYVVDKHGRLVPPGVPGELLIGGVGLARGYLNRFDLTAEKFGEYVSGVGLPTRVYRTGDLVRLKSGGDLEYLGRLDQQVKIRGYRIEAGEIEAVLVEHEGVQQAAVVVREDVSGDKRLVGYVVPKHAGNGSEVHRTERHDEAMVNAWRSHLLAQLPEYMVPSQFVTIDALPLTASGKVDARRLPTPGRKTPLSSDKASAPQNELEQQIAEIWRANLRVDRIRRYDNFFDLGGNSLLMAQVRIQLEQKFDREIAMLELFRYPTINSLADHIRYEQTSHAASQQGLRRAGIRLQSSRRNAALRES